jgi:hypothetical protein
MEMLSLNVSNTNCEKLVKSFLKKFNNASEEVRTQLRLPKKTLAGDLLIEAGILSQLQVAEALVTNKNNCLHLDGSKKKIVEYASFQVTTGDGEQLSMGVREMAKGDAESFHATFKQLVSESAELLMSDADQMSTVQKSTKIAQILHNFKSTMTYRHVVNKKFAELIQVYRENLIPLVVENIRLLSEDQIADISRMNNLFCGLHVLSNMAVAAKQTLHEF